VNSTGTFTWAGGTLGTGGGTFNSDGQTNITTSATHTLNAWTLNVGSGGAAQWNGASQIINSGNNAVLRVKPGVTLPITANPSISANLGGAVTFDNQGTVDVNTGGSTVTLNAAVTGN